MRQDAHDRNRHRCALIGHHCRHVRFNAHHIHGACRWALITISQGQTHTAIPTDGAWVDGSPSPALSNNTNRISALNSQPIERCAVQDCFSVCVAELKLRGFDMNNNVQQSVAIYILN